MKVISGILGIIFIAGVLIGLMYISRSFNAATLHNNVINPKPGIECVVVSSDESLSVDCWKTN